MSNTLLTVSMITKRAVAMFRNTNAFLQLIDRQYDDEYRNKDFKIGATLRIRLPVDYVVGTGATVTPQSTVENQTTLTVGTQNNVTTSFTSADFALSIDDFSERFLRKMMNDLAAAVAGNVMAAAEGTPNLVHNTSAGATISPTIDTWLAAGALLDNMSADRDVERKIVVSPTTNARTVSSFAGLFNPSSTISENWRKGSMNGTQGTLGVDDWRVDQTVINHVTGAYGTPTNVSGADQVGSSVTVVALNGPLNPGDIITLPGVDAVNRLTRYSTGYPQQFVVTALANTGATSISIYPSIIPVSAQGPTNTVQYANCTASPTSGSPWACATQASEVYRKNLMFRREAFALVCADLPLIRNGVVKSARESYDGISLRMVEGFDVLTDTFIDRIDILYGWCQPRPEWCVVIGDAI